MSSKTSKKASKVVVANVTDSTAVEPKVEKSSEPKVEKSSTKQADKPAKVLKSSKAETTEAVKEAKPKVVKSENAEVAVKKQVAKAKVAAVPVSNAVESTESKATPTKTVKKLVKSPDNKKRVALKSARKSVAEVKSTETVDASTITVVEKPKKKLVVAPGEVTVLNASGKKVSKSTDAAVKTTTKKVAKKSPAKKVAKKSPAKAATKSTRKTATKKKTTKVSKTATKSTAKKTTKKPKAVSKTGGKRVAKKGKSKTTKPKRPHNVKPAQIDYAGIGIGPAKIKKVLMHVSFNPIEHAVRKALVEAENKPVRPKPTKEEPAPEIPPQGHQTPIEKLDPSVLKVIRNAEAVHQQSLVEDYETAVISRMKKENPVLYKEYSDARKKANDSDEFNLYAFNKAFDAHFYDELETYCKENDSYSLDRMVKEVDEDGKETGEEHERFNQWTRAMALVNKMCIRLSNGVRDILACFLDNLVVQYARNGIYNCVAEKLSNLQLRHALSITSGFDERVPLDKFVRSMDGYELADHWVKACQRVREEIKEVRDKIRQGKIKGATDLDITMPEYPDPEHEETFENYVVEICRSVRIQMADEQKVAANKEAYHNIKISEYFKKFCSIIIYEAILRIGAHLKETITLKDVKTVNETLMYHSLRQLCNICGIDFEPIEADMKVRLDKFKVWCEDRRENRRRKRNQETDDVDQADEDQAELEEADGDDKDIVAEQEEVDAEDQETEADDEDQAEDEETGDQAEAETEDQETEETGDQAEAETDEAGDQETGDQAEAEAETEEQETEETEEQAEDLEYEQDNE